jgi:copper/silver efflux system protein
MIAQIIRWSLHNRVLVLLATLVLIGAGLYSVKHTPVDAIPDLSDVQVIIKTSYPGQAPQVVQDQVTYPLTTAMLAVPGATTVRGFSFFGDSYVYVLFADGTDLYWARSRVLEYLAQSAGNLPAAAKSQIGPDATGVGWIYLYALVDRSGQHDLAQLRSLQDWLLKFELQTVDGVAEVASVGGMIKQYQVVVDPQKLKAYNMPLSHVQTAIQRGNQAIGASVIEMAEAEYMVTSTAYVQSIADLEAIPLGVNAKGTAIQLRDVASIQLGPQMRRGIAELNGEGEVAGGVIVMRQGGNAQQTIAGVKAKLASLQASLPKGVEVVPVYDRSDLIERAVDNLWSKLSEELIIVALVCALFLWHLRSALVALVTLPIGILTAFIIMHWQGINANIMSLAGIAIAIGAMTDGAIVMIENLHKHLEDKRNVGKDHWQIVAQAATEVGPALFFSLLIITVSFLPVFMLQAQEGKLFAPLAFTKTYAMAASAGLAITLIPVLMGYFVRGKFKPQQHNPLNRWLMAMYRPVLHKVLNWPRTSLLLTLCLAVATLYPLGQLGSEFMPELDEGDMMYMPTTYAGVSVGKAREILQQTDKLIRTVPEVNNVFGKIGRADTATDPAPLTMIETFIQLKPQSEWRPGLNKAALRKELDELVQLPGLSNAWVMPIKTRIDMLATGIKTPLGIKVAGADLAVIQDIGRDIENILRPLQGTASVYAERVAGGRYINVDILRDQAARFGLNIADIQQVIGTAIGGMNVGQSTEGLERYPINLRYAQDYRDSPEALQNLPLVTQSGQHIVLADVANIRLSDGPPAIKSENARINGWIFIDVEGVDLGQYVETAVQVLSEKLSLPSGYSLNWAGQYEYMQRAKKQLSYVIPLTLTFIVVLLYLSFRRFSEVMIILLTLPLALIGGVWLLYCLDYRWSVAVVVGFIALAGLAVEIGVLMLVYLHQALQDMHNQTQTSPTQAQLLDAVIQGASMRLRPIIMTVATVFLGLLPVMLGSGTGSEVMSRIAAPMVGGIASALVLSLFVVPAVYLLWQQFQSKQH